MPLRRLDPRRAIGAGLLVALASPAHALQTVDARDGVAVEAILSIKEPTRIRIDGAPITDAFGNIYSSTCGATPAAGNPALPNATPAVNPAGEIVLECDRDKGEIYVRPVDPAPGASAKPVNLFVSSAYATYTLVLRRADTPADTIVIRDRTARAAPSTAADAGSAPLGPSAHHIRAMKALLVAMATDRVPSNVRVDEINQPVQLWGEARFSLMRRFEGQGLVGERYQLANVSPTVIVLAEQEFDRPDPAPASAKGGGQVLGVAIENHNLRPGESTSVYVIRRGVAR